MANTVEFLSQLDQIIAQRIAQDQPATSYTARIAAAGLTRAAQKVGEEGVELALAAATGADDEALLDEAADLLYHTLLLLQLRGKRLTDVCAVLESRHQAND
jgi:phosphoribosyl-ATP pyrophosphohydrolase/phosphoribosyl-AMP cyclohydrolase